MSPAPPFALRIAGAVIGFEISETHRHAVEAAFAHATVTPTDEPPTIWYRHQLFRDRMRFMREDSLRTAEPVPAGQTVELLIDDLQLSIALHASDEVFVHAGVVAHGGRAVILPGRSRAGKSTLVEALVRAGATYYSDEYARLGADGRVAPFARPVQLRTESGRRMVDAAGIGTVATEPIEPGLVLFTRHVPDAVFRPEVVAPARAALDVFDNTVIAEVAPDRATAAAARLARSAVTMRSDRGDVAEVVDEILALVESVEVPA